MSLWRPASKFGVSTRVTSARMWGAKRRLIGMWLSDPSEDRASFR
jgi:hypothetical protein